MVRELASGPEGSGSNPGKAWMFVFVEYMRSTCSFNLLGPKVLWVVVKQFPTGTVSGEYFPPLRKTSRNRGGGDR